ncbi:hypothetical protein HPB52_003310 [Rhipicephalus sanguineus]|uniref:Uncharacterized protein n=1 Tax=Rhipicephalus sanguineus TaxID=34632 RepID=A0A9D4QHI3_RHISA|nr:hypothetical protein HPB52_003310 [Rhipicephalus sanguineus]
MHPVPFKAARLPVESSVAKLVIFRKAGKQIKRGNCVRAQALCVACTSFCYGNTAVAARVGAHCLRYLRRIMPFSEILEAARAGLSHMLWACPEAPMRGEFPDGRGWNAALLSSDSQLQARLIRQAEDAARAHEIMADV